MSGIELYGYKLVVCFGFDREGRPDGSGCFHAFLVPEETSMCQQHGILRGQCPRCGAYEPMELNRFMGLAREYLGWSGIETWGSVVAVVFSRKGKESMSEKEFVLTLSKELRWFPPKDAQKLLDFAIEQNLIVRRKGGKITPDFVVSDAASMVPEHFRPGKNLLKELRDYAETLRDE